MFFGPQRQALLEFLRNLTPQVLLLTCALFLMTKLDWSSIRLTREGLGLTASFYMSVFLLAAAFVANLTNFLESAVTSTEELDVAAERIRRLEAKTHVKLVAIVQAGWRHNKRGLLQAVIAIIFAYASILPVTLMALQGAASLLKVAR